MKFTINGRPAEGLQMVSEPSPSWLRVVNYLDALPEGHLLTQSELAVRTSHDPSYIHKMTIRYDLGAERYLIYRRKTYYGSKKTVIEAKKYYASLSNGPEKKPKR